MESCIFCKIVRGELSSYKVYENDNFVAFLDINPRAPGHVQVIPKKHYRWIWDVPDIGAYFETVRTVAQALQKAFGQIEEIHVRVTGEEVPHAHVWIFPAPTKVEGDKNEFEKNAEKIRQALG